MGKFRKQVIAFAERAPGAIVQFAGQAGNFHLPRSNPDYEHGAALLRSAKESGIPVAFEAEGDQILSVG